MQKDTRANAENNQIRIWDHLIRIWHWLTAIVFIALWLTAELRLMEWHILLGIVMCGLLVFRIVWGFAGGSTARFSSFIATPARTVRYLRSVASPDYKPPAGHSPVGAVSAIAMILALLLQAISGLFTVNTDGLYSGPLSQFISFAEARSAGRLHKSNFDVLAGLVVLHLAAIMFYSVIKRAKLVGPMITGRRKTGETEQDARSLRPPGPVAIVVSVACAVCTSVLLYLL